MSSPRRRAWRLIHPALAAETADIPEELLKEAHRMAGGRGDFGGMVDKFNRFAATRGHFTDQSGIIEMHGHNRLFPHGGLHEGNGFLLTADIIPDLIVERPRRGRRAEDALDIGAAGAADDDLVNRILRREIATIIDNRRAGRKSAAQKQSEAEDGGAGEGAELRHHGNGRSSTLIITAAGRA